MRAPNCPYAQNTTSPQSPAEQALHLAKTSCPAFKDGHCPFRDAQTSSDLKKKISDVLPPSHVEKEQIKIPFKIALEHMHAVSQNLHDEEEQRRGEEYVLEGGCPFRDVADGKFRDVMESFSLSAIMGRLADDFGQDQQQHKGVEDLMEKRDETKEQEPSLQDKKKLSTELKKGTAKSHKSAENVTFVRNFIRGKIPRDLYSQFVSDLYFIYSALEEQLDKHAPTYFPSLHHPRQLTRKEVLEHDMEFFWGKDWKQTQKPTKASLDYIQRIEYIGQTNPLLLLSHAYTRYLGDLSGGRVLQRVAKKALQLQHSKHGLEFYEFELIENPKEFKNRYRQALDDMLLGERDVRKLVAEANVAFVLNMRVFEELDVMGGVEGASVRPLKEALEYFDVVMREGGEVKKEGDGKCPFVNVGKKDKDAKAENTGRKTVKPTTCPWPIILLHDSKKGLLYLKSWLVIGVALCVCIEHEFGRCPWPYVFAHDPIRGMTDLRTLILISIVICWYVVTSFSRKKHDVEKENTSKVKEQCPWPFVFLHDPKQGIRAYQTWIVVGLIASWIYNKYI